MSKKIIESKLIESSGLPAWIADVYAVPVNRIFENLSEKASR